MLGSNPLSFWLRLSSDQNRPANDRHSLFRNDAACRMQVPPRMVNCRATRRRDGGPGTSSKDPVPRQSGLVPLTIGVLPGEGVGPEVIDACAGRPARRGNDWQPPFRGSHRRRNRTCQPFGSTGQPLTREVIEFCEDIFARRGAILAGPAEGVSSTRSGAVRPVLQVEPARSVSRTPSCRKDATGTYRSRRHSCRSGMRGRRLSGPLDGNNRFPGGTDGRPQFLV